MPDPSPPPALRSTSDATPYVPVSWMAVAADLAAGLFVALLLLFGGSAAFKDRKPLIMPSLLIVAGIGVVLSFAARRMIRNSEGTRTGENLANAAWWTCVVGGLGYTAYLFGIEYSIQSDAKEQARQWVEQIKNGEYDRAFVKTLDPSLRAKARSDDPTALIAANRDSYVMFSQLDIVRLARRNPGAIEFEPKTLRDWAYRPGLIDCVFTGVVKCPEGTFPVEIPLKGSEGLIGAEGGGVRQWFVEAARPGGLIQVNSATLTQYGWRVTEMEMSGGEFGRSFLAGVRNGPEFYPLLYQLMVNPTANRDFWAGVPFLFRLWGTHVRVPAAAVAFTPDYFAHRWDQFLRMPDWEKATDEERKKFDDFRPKFLTIWNTMGVVGAGRPNGGRLPGNENIDAHNLVTITDTAVEVRVPCEIPALAGGDKLASRGRVVVVCDDKETIAELKRLREEAKGGSQSSARPPDFGKRQFRWRVVAIESDMQELSATPQGGQGGPGGAMPPPPPGVGG
jgi:hypothetical protein